MFLFFFIGNISYLFVENGGEGHWGYISFSPSFHFVFFLNTKKIMYLFKNKNEKNQISKLIVGLVKKTHY
jgi:hypothetical protein